VGGIFLEGKIKNTFSFFLENGFLKEFLLYLKFYLSVFDKPITKIYDKKITNKTGIEKITQLNANLCME
jgi:hypothetical protein